MLYYSTNHKADRATLRQAVVRGLATDRGLYMPEVIKQLPASFWGEIAHLSFQEVACRVADAFFGEDVEVEALRRIVCDTLQFDTPLVRVEDNIYALELFHGPTLAFKDVGARFMARLLQYFIKNGGEAGTDSGQASGPAVPSANGPVNVLVATSGDTGSAVANGFLGVEGIHVYVLYPKGKVSPIQECQFTTLGQNITAIEVDGVFDDCQALVKSAFMDADLNAHMRLTSANSINVARFLPQAFYYFWAYAQLQQIQAGPAVFCVPSGNFGNICSALFGHVMGLPVKRFIAANNANSVFYEYLQSGQYRPRPSVQTIANAMDVGDPSNFARILDLYGRADVQAVLAQRHITQPLPSLAGWDAEADAFISGTTYTDAQIADTMRQCYARTGYVLDPHGACGYRALSEQLRPGEVGIFLETAHPAKFKDTVDRILGTDIPIPAKLQAFMQGQKQSVPMSKDFAHFKAYLLGQ
ncbi:MAG: threonine synthase [Bacteroidaceae bacterium]|nr:threonine synthase [Bacteroidaceae bacterium]